MGDSYGADSVAPPRAEFSARLVFHQSTLAVRGSGISSLLGWVGQDESTSRTISSPHRPFLPDVHRLPRAVGAGVAEFRASFS